MLAACRLQLASPGSLLVACHFGHAIIAVMQNNNNQKPHFSRSDIHAGEIEGHVDHIDREFREGFDFLKSYPKSVTIFGSSMAAVGSKDYLRAQELGGRIVKELKYAVMTGGGPGIMEAANKGAKEAGGISLGLNISLPHEHKSNDYLTQHIKFSYFFTRKTMMMFAAEAYVYFPGGFGTFDELFSVLTLIQTGKIPRVPIILIDSEFWNPLLFFMKDIMLEKYHAIDPGNTGLFKITDSLDDAIEIIRKSPVQEWWRNIN